MRVSITSVRLHPEVAEGLEATSSRLQRSKSWLINQALREYLAKEATEAARWQATLGALESFNTGRVVEGERVHEWLRSWGNPNELSPPKPRT